MFILNNMEPYKFKPHNPLDDEEPCLPPKKVGECFRYMKVSFRNGKEFKGYDIFDVYVRTLQYIGFETATKVAYWSKCKRGGYPIISKEVHKEWTPRYKSYEIDGYHILKVKANSYRALINQISDTYKLGISVELL